MEAAATRGGAQTAVQAGRWRSWGKLNAVSFGLSIAASAAVGLVSPIHGIGLASGALSVGLGALSGSALTPGLTRLSPPAVHLIGTAAGWAVSAPLALLLSIAFVRAVGDTTTPTPFAAGMWLWALPAAVVYVIVGITARARRSR